MKLLTKIIMVNWYLFEAEEWHVAGHVALLGANGAGKSSFLDAMQYVLVGGNKKDWRPNAKAQDRKSERDIRGYVLGLIKSEEAIGDNLNYQPRDSALSRIVLVYTDQVTGEKTSVGAALTGRKEESSETVEGFFILQGLELSLADFVETTDGGDQIPRPYGQIKAMFHHRVDAQHCFLFAREPENFVAQLVRSLGPNWNPMDPKKYTRAFKQSISMTSLDGSVSDFVRTSVLDADLIDTDKMRESRDSYQRKKRAVDQTVAQIAALDQIIEEFDKSYLHFKRHTAYKWCSAELACDQLNNLLVELEDQLGEHFNLHRKNLRQFIETKGQAEQLSGQQQQINDALARDNGEAQRERLQNKIDQHKGQINDQETQLRQLRAMFGQSDTLSVHTQLIQPETTELLAAMAKAADQMNDLDLPAHPETLDQLIETSTQILGEETNHLFHSQVQHQKDLERCEARERELHERLVNLEHGGTDIGPHTQRLIELLGQQGIEAKPLCELVEVRQPEWQPAIEAYLRGNCEALIVDPDRAQEALQIYRDAKRDHNIFGAVVVNTRSIKKWLGQGKQPNSGSVAALVEGEDPLAVGYLHQMLANIECRYETPQLMDARRALTIDGMLVRQNGFQRLKLSETPRLGRGVGQKQIERIEEKLGQLERDRKQAESMAAQCKKAHSAASSLSLMAQNCPNIESVCVQVLSLREQIAELESQQQALDLSNSDRLRDQLKTVKGQLEKANKDQGIFRGDMRTARRLHVELKRQYRKEEAQLPAHESERSLIQQASYFDTVQASELLETQTSKQALGSSEDYQQAIKNCLDNAERNLRQANAAREQARTDAVQYNADFDSNTLHLEADPDFPVEENQKRVVDIRDQLKNLGLDDRKKDADQALQEAERVIRQDLAIKLKNQIDEMKRRISELNAELRDRPFTANQVYQFHSKPRAEYQEFLNFVQNTTIETAANVGGLFDSQTDEKFNAVQQLLDSDEPVDYREYFVFDIKIQDPESGIVEWLSKKKGSGSGGEQRSPFYVAMGASLASAYRINTSSGRPEGGFSLYLADEAFQSMDDHNTHVTADYLKSIGLQMFIAAPDEAERRMTPVVDTVMFFIRDGNRATVDVQHLTPKVKELFNKPLSDEELMA